MGFSTWQLVILLCIVLLLFGPKSLPKLGRMLGTGMREFKNAMNRVTDDEEDKDKKGNDSVEKKSAVISPTESADENKSTQDENKQ